MNKKIAAILALLFLILVFQFLVPKSLKYLKINSKTVAHVNIYGYIYIC